MMYHEFAEWWPLLSPPAEYEEEVEFFLPLLALPGIRTLLELGSGGGNNASFLKRHFAMTLVELSPDMIAVSRRLNPGLEHIEGDMRSVRLGRMFDAVFIHDAIAYMTSEADLLAALRTAAAHLEPGGRILLAPDYVRDTFEPSADHGGTDGDDGRGMRYLEWTYDPDPEDTTIVTDYVYALREADGAMRVEHDRHITGLFPRQTWLAVLEDAGFGQVEVVHDTWDRDLFTGVRQP